MAYRMTAFHQAVFMLAAGCCLTGQALHPLRNKEWRFETEWGTVALEASIGLPGRPTQSSLGIAAQSFPGPPLARETALVGRILTELPALGGNPRELAFIRVYLGESDVRAKLAVAAARSQKWRNALKKGTGTEEVVAELLNTLGAYNSLDSARNAYGLRVAKVGGVEEVLVDRFKTLKISGTPNGINDETLVPTGASLYIELAKQLTP